MLPVEQRLAPGEEQTFWVPRAKVHVFDAESERAVVV
jgi:hypothetical protein